VSCQKNVKKRTKHFQVFTFSTLKLLTNTFTVKQLYTHHTHVMLYIQHYIKTVHFWLKYIITLLLCKRQQNWLRVVTVVFRTIGILLRFFTFFTFF